MNLEHLTSCEEKELGSLQAQLNQQLSEFMRLQSEEAGVWGNRLRELTMELEMVLRKQVALLTENKKLVRDKYSREAQFKDSMDKHVDKFQSIILGYQDKI